MGALAGLVAQHVGIGANDTACAATPGQVQPPSATRPTIVVTLDYACAAPPRTLSLTDNTFDLFGPDHHTLVIVQWPDWREQLLFKPGHRVARLARPGEATAPDAGSAQSNPPAVAFFRLGVEHILTGYDHLLFLFALLLRGGRLRSLIGIVTAFTVAHSITLALAVPIGVVVIPPAIVEPVIALSIAYVALENIVHRQAASGRWLVSFVFGLVHGFGFAGVLLELGLPPGRRRHSSVTAVLQSRRRSRPDDCRGCAVPLVAVVQPLCLGTLGSNRNVRRSSILCLGAGDRTRPVRPGLIANSWRQQA